MSFYRFFRPFIFFIFLLSAVGCSIEPLHKTAAITASSDFHGGLSSLSVAKVDNRVAQRVRNELLFSLHGGNPPTPSALEVELDVAIREQEHSVLTAVRGATAAHIELSVSYRLVDKSSGGSIIVAKGERQALAGYDLTPQNFANRRARYDAENRAAKAVAQLIRLALAQNLVELR